jgi:hypothetical protein
MAIKKMVSLIAAVLVGGSGLAWSAPAAFAQDPPGSANPNCITLTTSSGAQGTNCLEVSNTITRVDKPVTFRGSFQLPPAGTSTLCLARSNSAYGAYRSTGACGELDAKGNITITTKLKRGSYFYDLGIPQCLAKPPAQRSPAQCGDNGGVMSLPIDVVAAYFAGENNPMCANVGDETGFGWNCMTVRPTSVRAGQPVTFTATFQFPPKFTKDLCLARSTDPYGVYIGIDACSTLTKDGTITIVANLDRPGTFYYDLGDPGCLNLPPAKRPIKRCGGSGGVEGMAVKVTVR